MNRDQNPVLYTPVLGQCCGQCGWIDFSGTEYERAKYNILGTYAECEWPYPVLTLPDSITGITDDRADDDRKWMRPVDGATCPCFKPRENTNHESESKPESRLKS